MRNTLVKTLTLLAALYATTPSNAETSHANTSPSTQSSSSQKKSKQKINIETLVIDKARRTHVLGSILEDKAHPERNYKELKLLPDGTRESWLNVYFAPAKGDVKVYAFNPSLDNIAFPLTIKSYENGKYGYASGMFIENKERDLILGLMLSNSLRAVLFQNTQDPNKARERGEIYRGWQNKLSFIEEVIGGKSELRMTSSKEEKKEPTIHVPKTTSSYNHIFTNEKKEKTLTVNNTHKKPTTPTVKRNDAEEAEMKKVLGKMEREKLMLYRELWINLSKYPTSVGVIALDTLESLLIEEDAPRKSGIYVSNITLTVQQKYLGLAVKLAKHMPKIMDKEWNANHKTDFGNTKKFVDGLRKIAGNSELIAEQSFKYALDVALTQPNNLGDFVRMMDELTTAKLEGGVSEDLGKVSPATVFKMLSLSQTNKKQYVEKIKQLYQQNPNAAIIALTNIPYMEEEEQGASGKFFNGILSLNPRKNNESVVLQYAKSMPKLANIPAGVLERFTERVNTIAEESIATARRALQSAEHIAPKEINYVIPQGSISPMQLYFESASAINKHFSLPDPRNNVIHYLTQLYELFDGKWDDEVHGKVIVNFTAGALRMAKSSNPMETDQERKKLEEKAAIQSLGDYKAIKVMYDSKKNN